MAFDRSFLGRAPPDPLVLGKNDPPLARGIFDPALVFNFLVLWDSVVLGERDDV